MKDSKQIVFEDLTVVIILYKSSNLVLKLIDEIKTINILLVDNGGNKNILKDILKRNKNTKIISPKKNLGFGGGVNFAIHHINTKFFIILNPDLLINEDNIRKLLYTILTNKNCAIAAPITKPDKDFYGIFPENGKGIVRNEIEQNTANILENKLIEGLFCADVVKGCAMLINTKVFKDIGMFNEKYFLFWEEVDLCRRIRSKNLSIIICHDSQAKHIEGSSSRMDLKTFFIRAYHNELSPFFYYKVKKLSFNLTWKMLKYLFRSFTYLATFNIKNSIKNIAKFLAILNYIFRLN